MRAVHNERGVALVLALVVILILAAIVLGIAHMTTAEIDIHRLTRWDTLLQYVAQAGVEHQIYVLKGNKDAAAVGYTNYPAISGAYLYITSLACTLNCTLNPAVRRWTITSFGEIWGATLLQQRTVRAQVEITYVTCGGVTNGCPSNVTLLRWEEVYP